MARRTKEEALETRNSLIAAALELFCEKGVARTTLTDIARAAGVTRGALYWHFRDKVDLFEAVWERLREPLTELSASSESPTEPQPLLKMRELLILLLETVAESNVHQQIFRLMINRGDLDAEMQEIDQHVRTMHRSYRERLARILANAVTHKQLPRDLPVELAAFTLQSSLDGLIANWMINSDEFDLAARAPELADALLAMLRVGFTASAQNASKTLSLSR